MEALTSPALPALIRSMLKPQQLLWFFKQWALYQRTSWLMPLASGVPHVHTQPRNHSPGNQLRPRVVQFPFQLQIGCHTDDLMSASELSRAPVVTHQCHMDRTEQSVSNLWGGLLYIIVPMGCNLGPVSITIKRAVPAPYYKLGEWTERGGGERGMLCSCGLVAQECVTCMAISYPETKPHVQMFVKRTLRRRHGRMALALSQSPVTLGLG